MHTPRDAEALAEFVRSHHVHFDVAAELAYHGGRPAPVGHEVRLFAVHDRGARALPGSGRSRALVAELRSLAEWLLPPDERPALVEIEPASPTLYDSREVAGADEVALTLRLAHEQRGERRASEERCLRGLRDKLRALGAAER